MSAGAVATMLGTFLGVVAVLGPWLLGTASRLDRLHIRADAAWAGLDAALARRAVVTRALAAAGCLPDAEATTLRVAADDAERAGPPEREVAESELTRLLGELDRDVPPPGLVAELVEAEQRLVLARRVYNDAVRDTRALRRGRLVRWLRLAGTAAAPEFFEIAEPGTTPPRRRRSVRVLLADDRGRVLLRHAREPAGSAAPFWCAPGGGVRGEESLRAAAVRELRAETGLCVPENKLTGPTWVRRGTYPVHGTVGDGEEWFFLLRVNRADIDTSANIPQPAHPTDGYRWWSAEELVSTTDTVFPERLAQRLPEVLSAGWDGRIRDIG